MTVITVTCPDCNLTADITPDGVALLRVNGDCRYCWACPGCKVRVHRPATANVIRLLMEARIYVQDVAPPIPSQRPAGPPLTEDDLIRMGLELQRMDGQS